MSAKVQVGVGGASGNGIVYEKGKMIGKGKDVPGKRRLCNLGGQAYRELIFFENQEALDRFKKINSNFPPRHQQLLQKQVLLQTHNTGMGS